MEYFNNELRAQDNCALSASVRVGQEREYLLLVGYIVKLANPYVYFAIRKGMLIKMF